MINYKKSSELKNGFDIEFSTKYPDIDLYPVAGMFLPEAKERQVDVSLIKNHIRRAQYDKNSLALIMGPLGVIPTIYRHFTIEDALKGKNEIAQLMNNIELLDAEYEEFNKIDTEEKKDEYYLKGSEQFKMYRTIVENGMRGMLDINKKKDGKVDITSKDFNSAAKKLQNILFEQYLQEITEQYVKILKPLQEKDKILGFIPSNEEIKSANIGAFDIMDAVSEKLDLKDRYVKKNFVKILGKYSSYLTDNQEKIMKLYASALPTNSLIAGEKLIKDIAKHNPDYDVFVLSSSIGTGILNNARWYFDREHNVYVSKPQVVVMVPTYASIIEPNQVRRKKSIMQAQTHEYKLKLSVIKNPSYINHPELVDKNGKIIDIDDPEYLKGLEVVDLSKEKIRHLKSIGRIYQSPFEISVDLIELGTTQSTSKLIKSSHITNAPKSFETLQKINFIQDLIDNIGNDLRKNGGRSNNALAEAYDNYNQTDASSVQKVMEEMIKQMSQKHSDEMVKSHTKGGGK